jgi:hypothetical protein
MGRLSHIMPRIRIRISLPALQENVESTTVKIVVDKD